MLWTQIDDRIKHWIAGTSGIYHRLWEVGQLPIFVIWVGTIAATGVVGGYIATTCSPSFTSQHVVTLFIIDFKEFVIVFTITIISTQQVSTIGTKVEYAAWVITFNRSIVAIIDFNIP